jgi:hypothetical protein
MKQQSLQVIFGIDENFFGGKKQRSTGLVAFALFRYIVGVLAIPLASVV